MNGVPNAVTIKAYIKGMDMTQSVCDIIAMLAPVSGLPPQASGKMIVLRPIGIAVAKKVKNSMSLSIESPKIIFASVFRLNVNKAITAGNTTRRKAVTM